MLGTIINRTCFDRSIIDSKIKIYEKDLSTIFINPSVKTAVEDK